MKSLFFWFIILWQGLAMANDYAQKIQQLSDQYKKQITEITTNEKDPQVLQTKIKKITDEYQKNTQELQQNQIQKSNLSKYKEVLDKPHSKVVVDETKSQNISPDALSDLMKHPEKHNWSDWVLASKALNMSGAKRQAYFAWSVFKVLGFAVVKTEPAMDVVRMRVEHEFGHELVAWITQDPDTWAKLFSASLNFCIKASWDQQNSGAKTAAIEFYDQNKNNFSTEGLKKIKAERVKNKLPIKKLTDAELGPELPKAWIL